MRDAGKGGRCRHVLTVAVCDPGSLPVAPPTAVEGTGRAEFHNLRMTPGPLKTPLIAMLGCTSELATSRYARRRHYLYQYAIFMPTTTR
jgi:hypothetical protein